MTELSLLNFKPKLDKFVFYTDKSALPIIRNIAVCAAVICQTIGEFSFIVSMCLFHNSSSSKLNPNPWFQVQAHALYVLQEHTVHSLVLAYNQDILYYLTGISVDSSKINSSMDE
jgi:hypothetical protein